MSTGMAYYLLERFPRIKDGDGSFFEWIEVFPGIRVWWHDCVHSDNTLIANCKNIEHYYAMKWIEARSRRLNQGFVCELEVIPSEAEKHFEEMGLKDGVVNKINFHNLVSTFTSLCILLQGYNNQTKICGELNESWRFLSEKEPQFPLQIGFSNEIANDDWWDRGQEVVSEIEVGNWESFRPLIWDSGYLLFLDQSSRYSDFMEFYQIAMQTEDPLERNSRFCRCLETIIRRSDGISRHLVSRSPLLAGWNDTKFQPMEGDVPVEEANQTMMQVIKKAWQIRSKYTHGQTLKEIDYDKLMFCLGSWPQVLHWITRGLISLGRVPTNDEFEIAEKIGSLDWRLPIDWEAHDWTDIENEMYRIDGTFRPKLIQQYNILGGKNKMSYDDFLDEYGY